MNRFAALVMAIVCISAEAHAGVELSGVLGLHMFNEDNGLGTPSGQMPVSLENSALFGLRLGVYFGPMLGVEAEGGLIPGETRDGPEGTTPLVAVTALTYRGQLVAQFRAADPTNKIIPFVLAGGGLLQIVDTKNDTVIEKESQTIFYGGAGVKYRTADGWIVRLDGRVLLPPGNDGRTQDFEALIGIGKDFGHKKVVKKEEEVELPKVDEDPDKDGIVGAADKCPTEPEDQDSFQDDDGCVDADNDGDGLADAADKCPLEAEDKDNFEDDNGCPDPDNDGDGVPDAADKCGDQPETQNGFEDEDGCPDEIPEKLKKFTGVIQGITFKTSSVDLIGGSKKTLDAAAAVLAEFKDTKLEIQGHTDDVLPKKGGAFADNDALSQARAEAVKAYLMTKGIEEGRLIAKGYGATQPVIDPTGLKGGKLNQARAKNRRVEFKLVTPEAAGATTPTPEPTPAPEATPAPKE